jgi:dTDP-4-dehydrorhamnose reductase
MIILLGGSGYVGSAFRAFFETRGIPCRSVSRAEIDYADQAVLASFLREIKPRFLINAAGYTGRPNVDACELHTTECLAGNAVLPGIVAAACAEAGVSWGQVSSGCIFTGDKGISPDGKPIGFTEADAPNFSFRQNNCSFYSGTKALGEEVLRDAPGCYIWRLRIPFDRFEGPRNYLTKVMRYERLLEATNSLSQLHEFVRACWETHEKGCLPGIYNVTNPGHVTTREVVALIEKAGVCRKEFSFFRDEAEFMRVAAKTPRSNCVLDTRKLSDSGIAMTEVHEAIEIALREWVKAS